MALSKALFLLCLNLVFLTLVTSTKFPIPSPPPPSGSGYNQGSQDGGDHSGSSTPVNHVPASVPVPVPSPPPPSEDNHSGGDHDGSSTPVNYVPVTIPVTSLPAPSGSGVHQGDHDDIPNSSPLFPASKGGKCPKDVLKIQACVSVLNGLNGLAKAVVGPQRAEKCCSLLDGLVAADAGVCLCTTLTPHVLGLHLKVPVSVNLLLNFCKKAGVPANFQCPAKY